jgi:hypothetical protein
VNTLHLIGPRRDGRWRRYLGAATSNPAGSIYGTIVATSVIAIEGALSPSLGDLIGTDLTTVLVYWLAHVYASFVASGQSDEQREHLSGPRRLARIMGHEWSVVAGSFLPLLAVLIGGLFTDDVATAALVGLWAGVALLYGWGFAASRAAGRDRPASFAYGLVAALFGVTVITMRVLLH